MPFGHMKILVQGGGSEALVSGQEVVKLHGSRIRFHSDGEGCGTRSASIHSFLCIAQQQLLVK